MESLIHHFKIVTEGYRVPEGEVYVDRRVAARRVGVLRRLRRWAEAVARQVPRAVVRRARSDRDLHADALIADMIAIVGSLDTVMGEVDR